MQFLLATQSLLTPKAALFCPALCLPCFLVWSFPRLVPRLVVRRLFAQSSGKDVVQLDFSSCANPMVSAGDLLQLTILPDLADGKCERTKRVCDRLRGAAAVAYDPNNKKVDNSSCLHQRIGPGGQTALHMAIDQNNQPLANVLANEANAGQNTHPD